MKTFLISFLVYWFCQSLQTCYGTLLILYVLPESRFLKCLPIIPFCHSLSKLVALASIVFRLGSIWTVRIVQPLKVWNDLLSCNSYFCTSRFRKIMQLLLWRNTIFVTYNFPDRHIKKRPRRSAGHKLLKVCIPLFHCNVVLHFSDFLSFIFLFFYY